MKPFLLLVILCLICSLTNAQWTEQISGTTNWLTSVSAVNDNVAWICGDGGVVLRTTDGGTTWENRTGPPISGTLLNIFAWDSSNALCTSTPGATFVYRTTDGGSSWAQVFTQTGGFIDAIWMTSASDGFMMGDPVGSRWSLWRTSDGGATWDSTGLFLPQAGAEFSYGNAMYVNGSNIYFGTGNSRIYYSSDNGLTWTTQATTPYTDTFAIWFNSSTRGIASSGNSTVGFQLISTTNGGTNWNNLPSLGPNGDGSFSMTGYGNRWFYTRGFGIYSSNDDGANWALAYEQPGGYFHMSKARDGSDVVWAVQGDGGITKGTDVFVPVELISFNSSIVGDNIKLTWQTATEINNKGFEVYRNGNKIFFVDGKGTITETQDYTFVDENLKPGLYNYRLNQIDFDGKQKVVGELTVYLTIPEQFSLNQNYPNPFNPTTTIKFSQPSSVLVTLKVFDVLGNEIAVLVNENKLSGNYEVDFDARTLPSGVYLYKLQAGSFVETKKMLLVK